MATNWNEFRSRLTGNMIVLGIGETPTSKRGYFVQELQTGRTYIATPAENGNPIYVPCKAETGCTG